jgi:RNA polymerase sigma factor (sigma-70 family)
MSPKESEKISSAYKTERKRLLGYIRNRIPFGMEAEDILQDVFYQLTLGFRDLDRIENLTAWLYKVTNNRIIDYFRKKKPVHISYTMKAGDDEEGPLSLADILPALGSTPEDEEIKERIWEMTEEVLNGLPDEQRDVFVANEFDNMGFKEMSASTGIPVNTLISRKRYAVLALRAKLEDLYELFKNKSL